jgi:hypothetical protein
MVEIVSFLDRKACFHFNDKPSRRIWW